MTRVAAIRPRWLRSISGSAWMRWIHEGRARLVGVFLLMIWVGPVTLVQTDVLRSFDVGGARNASAESQIIPAGKAMYLEPGMKLQLHLRDGRVVEGRLRGRSLLDATTYAPRFAARSSDDAPLAWGETLRVVPRHGRERTAVFAGYAELTLLLQESKRTEPIRLPFESLAGVVRTNGERIEASRLVRAFQAHELPSAEALDLEDVVRPDVIASLPHTARPRAQSIQVPGDDVDFVVVHLSHGVDVVGIVVLCVLVSVVVFYVMLARLGNSISKGCRSFPGTIDTRRMYGVRLTSRPFDRSRAWFAGEAAPMPNPSWAEPDLDEALAAGASASSGVPTR